MKNVYTAILLINSILIARGGNENPSIGARSSAMGNASVSLSDVWSAGQNQAGLGFLRHVSAGIYYENRFLLKELSVKGVAVAFPVKAGTFGICVTHFGYTLYNENKYNLSFAKSFGDKLSASVAMDYLTTRIAEGYGNKGVFAAEVGIQAKPLKRFTIGAHIFNPTRTKLNNYDNERIPTIVRLGVDYNFSDKVIVAIETEKHISKKATVKVGIEYKAVKEFYLRAGICTSATLSSFGFGLNLKNIKIDFSANYHQLLGISPQLGLSYSFKKSGTSKTD